jgi:hypothetical protein
MGTTWKLFGVSCGIHRGHDGCLFCLGVERDRHREVSNARVTKYRALLNASFAKRSLGLLALGLESTLPVPQLLSNHQRKSTEGFSDLVLAGYVWFKKKHIRIF